MPRTDWRSYPRFVRAAEQFTELPWTDAKWTVLCDYLEPIDQRLVPLFLAILIQEGTGSFNTSSANRAGDGGNGAEAEFRVDLQRAADLVLGKLMLYPQAVEQGFCERAARIVSQVGDDTWSDAGSPIQWVNWPTAVVRPNGAVECLAMYAQDAASWWVNVQWLYERELGGTRDGLTDVCHRLEMGAPLRGTNVGAPLMQFSFGWVKQNVNLACTYGDGYALVPRPAVIVTAASPAGARVRVGQPDTSADDPEAPELVPPGSYLADHPEFARAAASRLATALTLFVAGQAAGACQLSGADPILTSPVADLLKALGYTRGQGFIWNPAPPGLFITDAAATPVATDDAAGQVPLYVNGVRVAGGSINAENRLMLETPLPRLLASLGFKQSEDWYIQPDPPGLYISPKQPG